MAAAQERLESVMAALDDIRAVTEPGIRTLMEAHRWGGAAFHDAGWNPRHIEGVEHFLFYNLERLTGRQFIHGQPVGLGIVFGSFLQDNEPERMLAALDRVGVDIRPEAMGVTWVAGRGGHGQPARLRPRGGALDDGRRPAAGDR